MAKWVNRIVLGAGRVTKYSAPKTYVNRLELRRNRELDLLYDGAVGNRSVISRYRRNGPCKLDVFRFQLPDVAA